MEARCTRYYMCAVYYARSTRVSVTAIKTLVLPTTCLHACGERTFLRTDISSLGQFAAGQFPARDMPRRWVHICKPRNERNLEKTI